MGSNETEHAASSIRSIGDTVNKAIDAWADAGSLVNDALLPPGSLGKDPGEKVLDRYEPYRLAAHKKLIDSINALTDVREALYGVADAYVGNDAEVASQVERVRTHRPEIDDL